MRIRGYSPATPCWAELASGDPEAATSFYCGLFGWEAEPTEVGSTLLKLGGAIAAGVTPAPPETPTSWLAYVSTEDIDAVVDNAGAEGGTVLAPVHDVGNRGRRALLADPEGAVFGVWQAGTFRGAQIASEPGAVCWHEIATWDLAAAAAFYGKVFGWTEQRGELASAFEYWEWSVNNRVVGGITPMAGNFPPEVPAHWRVTVEVADCAAVAARCTELGGQVVIGPLDVVVGHYAQLIDPTGGALGVIELIPELRLTP